MRIGHTGGGEHYYHRNQQYSITALTDQNGNVKERYSYTAYGKLGIYDNGGTARTTSNYDNRYTYTGREWDETAELYHYRARMYDPLSGRFCSRDPIGYVENQSLYQYVKASPLNRTDPSGLLSVCCRPMRTGGIGDRIIDHCQLRNRCVSGETESPVWPDRSPNRSMDDGTKCANATRADIEACIRRNQHSDQPHGGPPGMDNNCQSSTVDRIAKCCLKSNWRPGIVANPRGPRTKPVGNGWPIMYRRAYEGIWWRCNKVPAPLPTDAPICPPIDDFSHHGWPQAPPDVVYPSTDDPSGIFPMELRELRLDF